MDLVDEDNHVARLDDLGDDAPQAFLEVTAKAGASHQSGQVQLDQAHAVQSVGAVPGRDPLGEALNDGGLASTGLTDEDRVVLAAAQQDLRETLELEFAADERIEAPAARHLCQVAPELGKQAFLRAVVASGLALALGRGAASSAPGAAPRLCIDRRARRRGRRGTSGIAWFVASARMVAELVGVDAE